MKKLFVLLAAFVCWNTNYAQWVPSLKLTSFQSFTAISAPDDETIWAITRNFVLYSTADGGMTWNEIHPKGLAQDISVSQLYAVNSAVAFLSVNTDFTGVGPGILYRTTDGGRHWARVFSHRGNCEIKTGMFDKHTGLLSCSFSSFNNSIKSGQQLYLTIDGGKHWRMDPLNPSPDYYIASFAMKDRRVAMADFQHVYFSNNRGLSWSHPKQKIAARDLQFEDSSYAVANGSSNIDILVKRPGNNWISEGDVTGIGGAVTGLVLDGNECWFGMAFDTRNNYYSSDSAKTFTPFIADSTGGFEIMTKARAGKTLIGATPFFASSTLWINKRIQDTSDKVIITSIQADTNPANEFAKQSMPGSKITLQQNVPNPFKQATTISYTLPPHYSSASIIITDIRGLVIKELPVTGMGKGGVVIDAAMLASGTYFYSLIVDAKLRATKQLMIIK